MACLFIPKGKHLVVEVRAVVKRSHVLEVQQTAADKQTGRVVAVGPEVTGIKVGELVFFSKWAGADASTLSKDQPLAILREQDVIAALDEAAIEQQEKDAADREAQAIRNLKEARAALIPGMG